jgi:PAS domain S-box-containing protein
MSKQVVETGQAVEFEDRYQADGVDGWFFTRITPIPDGIAISSNDITERKRAQRQIEASEARFNEILDNFTEACVIFDSQWRYKFVNEIAAQWLGVSKDYLLGKVTWEVYPQRVGSVTYDQAMKTMEDRIPRSWEDFSIVTNSWYEYRVIPCTDGLAYFANDITARKKAEEALRESEERFRTVQENSLDRFTILKPFYDNQGEIIDFTYIWTNARAAMTVGHRPEYLIGRRMSEIFPAVLQTRFVKICKRAAETGQATEFEDHYQAHGVDEWFFVRVTPIPDGIAIATQIITERKRAEEALLESQVQLEAELTDIKLLQSISVELLYEDNIQALHEKIIDAAARIMHSEYASMQMFYPERGSGGELQLLAFRGFNPQAAKFWEWVRADSESTCGVALHTGKRVIVPDVENCDFMAGSEDQATYRQTGIRAVQTTPLLSRKGKLVGMISTHWCNPHEPSERNLRLLDILARQAADLIERKQAEKALQKAHDSLEEKVKERTAELEKTYNSLIESEEKYRNIVETTYEGILTIDAELRITYVNKRMMEMLGYCQEELIGRPWCDLFDEEGKAVAKLNMKKRRQGINEVHEFRLMRKDGSHFWALVSSKALFDNNGKFAGSLSMHYDLTERKEAEEALARIELIRKQEIHHRIKNNLQVISSLLDLQSERFGEKEEIKNSEVLEAFRNSQDRVISMALIHEELYKGGGFETLNFSPYIKKLVESLFHTYNIGNTDIGLNMDLVEDAFFDMDTAVPLGIIVNELVSNSFKHAFKGRDRGEIRIRLHREEKEDCESVNFILTVSDNGVGIPENLEIEDLDSLGMQLVTTLVDQLDGELELKKNNGTEFTMKFAVIKKNDQATAPALQQSI